MRREKFKFRLNTLDGLDKHEQLDGLTGLDGLLSYLADHATNCMH